VEKINVIIGLGLRSFRTAFQTRSRGTPLYSEFLALVMTFPGTASIVSSCLRFCIRSKVG
jgi:hypothetical protein